MEAIRRYVEQGGAFTVATGRPTRGVLIYPELMALVNLPIITYNGACIYDTVAKRTVWRRLLPESFAPLVREVLERFPRTGALVFHREDDETCVIRPDPYTYEITWVREHYDAPVRDLDEISLPWNKVVIAGPPEDVEACAAYVRAHTPAPVTVILSEGTFLELTGPDVGKGEGAAQGSRAGRRGSGAHHRDRRQYERYGDALLGGAGRSGGKCGAGGLAGR